jgi:hypothetical protein
LNKALLIMIGVLVPVVIGLVIYSIMEKTPPPPAVVKQVAPVEKTANDINNSTSTAQVNSLTSTSFTTAGSLSNTNSTRSRPNGNIAGSTTTNNTVTSQSHTTPSHTHTRSTSTSYYNVAGHNHNVPGVGANVTGASSTANRSNGSGQGVNLAIVGHIHGWTSGGATNTVTDYHSHDISITTTCSAHNHSHSATLSTSTNTTTSYVPDNVISMRYYIKW